MNPCDPILFRQLPLIRKIIQDETWLEGERRGCHVHPDDRVVREKVCQIVLKIGQQLRESLAASESAAPARTDIGLDHTPPTTTSQNEAA